MQCSELGILYCDDRRVDVAAFVDILARSGLSARRPVRDASRLQRMLAAYSFVLTAWSEDSLVGISTVWTDYAFTAYLADLAVDVAHQGRGIGTRLLELSRHKAGPETTLMLLAAPAAAGYYPHIGMERFTDCFLIRRTR